MNLAYRPEVFRDLQPLPANIRKSIIRAIEGRLLPNPTLSGKPLRGKLLGYWRLRVGDHRILYGVTGTTVTIYAVRHRKDAYAKGLEQLLR